MKYISLLLLLCACSSIPIYDAEWCADKGPMGAVCFHTLTSDKDRVISKADWDSMSLPPNDKQRFGQVCTQAETFAQYKASISKLCALSKACIYQTQADAFFKKVELTTKK